MNKYFYNIFQCGNLLIKAMSYLQLISVIPRVNSFQTVRITELKWTGLEKITHRIFKS